MTFRQVGNLYLRRADLVELRLMQAARGILIAALRLSKLKLTEGVYALPVDLNSRGRPKWRRTGNLRRSELGEIRQPLQVVISNKAAYAEPRHEAGKPGRRRINPIRISHWRDEMFAIMRPIATESWLEAIRSTLRRG